MKNWKHISIFVSSTFKDMDVERDALRSFVEPRINKYLGKYMISVEFIDLRHSVQTNQQLSTEERERQICSVCFQEIDRCTPYFIGLLGHRYGWIPPKGIIDSQHDNPLPIEGQYLSVTSHEYNRGLFKYPNKVRGCVFLRDKSSYRNISSEALSDYVDNGRKLEYVKLLRSYVKNSDNVKTIDYNLDLGNINSTSISEWVEMVYKTIIGLILPESIVNEQEDELFEFISVQEQYVQNKLRDFKGREKELDECIKKIEQKKGCIIAESEYGLGMHSIICKLYDLYRQSNDNVCLFYAIDVFSESSDFNRILYYWTRHLNTEYFANTELPSSVADGDIITKQFEMYVERLRKQGKRVYMFVCNDVMNIPEKIRRNDNIILCRLMLYTPEIAYARPLIYMVEPYRLETVSKILETLRPAVRARLLKHPCCQRAKWLNIAKGQLDRMDKMDYLVIRHHSEDDNEQSIINYQLNMIDEFPTDDDEMLVRWHMKIREYLGNGIVDKIIYTIGLAYYGISASACCKIVGCEMIEFMLVCHSLGQYVVSESENALWRLNNRNVLITTLTVISIEDKKIVNNRLNSNLLPDNLSRVKLKIYILSDNIDGFVKLLESFTSRDEDLNKSPLVNDFVWMACYMPLDVKRFISKLTKSYASYSYQFINNLLICVKNISYGVARKIYPNILSMLKYWLKNLWEKGLIDSMAHSVLGEIVYCEAEMYYEQKNYKAYSDIIEYGLTISSEYMKEFSHWTKPYLYYLYEKICTVAPNVRYEILKKSFIALEKSNMITIPEGDDPTIYGITLMEASKYCIAADNNLAEHFTDKAINIFMNIVEGRLQDKIKTPLQLIDTVRNLLCHMYIALYLHENSNGSIINKNWVLQKGMKVIEKCRIHKDIFTDDICFFYYYNIIGRLIRMSSGHNEEKIVTLYDYIFEMLSSKKIDYLSFGILMRNSQLVSYDFAAYISLMSQILLLLSETEGHKCRSTERIEDEKTHKLACVKRGEYIIFEDELKYILPIIGAKQRDSNGLMPDLLKLSMISIYSSIINVELRKSVPNGKYIKQLFNSCIAEIDIINSEYILPYSIRICDKELLQEILDKYYEVESFYDDFNDCFDLPGDAYVSPNGMWANGDPSLRYKLEIIDVPNKFTWSRELLEEKIENCNYDEIIGMFHNKEILSVYEAYYLGLALMRTEDYEDAFNVMTELLASDLSEEVISDGEIFSVITNFLISCLLSGHFEEYKDVYSRLNQDDYLDDDIIEINDAYEQFFRDGDFEINLPKPYGYII